MHYAGSCRRWRWGTATASRFLTFHAGSGSDWSKKFHFFPVQLHHFGCFIIAKRDNPTRCVHAKMAK